LPVTAFGTEDWDSSYVKATQQCLQNMPMSTNYNSVSVLFSKFYFCCRLQAWQNAAN